MKTFFLEAKAKVAIKLKKKDIALLPKTIGLFAAVQFIHKLDDIKEQLEAEGKIVKVYLARHSHHKGQLLGCGMDEFNDCDAFLYLGDGLFHPKALMINNDKEVYRYDPFAQVFDVLDRSEMIKTRNKQKAALKKFYMSTEIGVLVSTKYGQNFFKKAQKLKEKYKDKNFYFLIFNTIDFDQLENFNFIECFVNTACPRVAYDDQKRITKPVCDMDAIEF